MLIQTGVVFGSEYDRFHHRVGAGGDVAVLWTPWKFGGIWSEAGVMDDPYTIGFLDGSPIPTDPEKSRQRLEASAGLILVGSKATGAFLRAGVGAYGVEAEYTSPKVIVAEFAERYAPSNRTRWGMGGSLGLGLRLGSQAMRALPTLEARLHVAPGHFGDTELPFQITGGFWFR